MAAEDPITDAKFAPFLDIWGLTPEGGPLSGKDVLFVRRGDEHLVLKRLTEGHDEWRMAEVLAHWQGQGAVRLVAAAPGAALTERALPGRELVELHLTDKKDKAAAIFCGVLAALGRPAPPAEFRTVDDWGQGFARIRDRGLAAGIDGGLINKAEAIYADLCASQGPKTLLHGDLHHYNIVEDANRGWLAIDPKGVVGEAACDTGAWLRNLLDATDDPAAIERCVALISERLGFERERIIGWHFAQAVLSALWGVEDGNYHPSWLGCAWAAETLL